MTQSDMRDIQADIVHMALSVFTREALKLAGPLMSSTAATPSDAKWQESLKLFSDWDGRMNIDSHAAPIAVEMRNAFRRRILENAVGAERAKKFSWGNEGTFLDRIVTERPRDWLPSEFKDYLELMRASEKEAREVLAKSLGVDDTKWTWGKYRPTRLKHPLAGVPLFGDQFAIPPFPQNGSGGVVNVGPYVSMRIIATLDNWDETRQGIALGISGDPASKHFKDQLDDWLAVTPRVFPFSKDAVAKAAQSTMVLVPAK
jgi:penicillin amidase